MPFGPNFAGLTCFSCGAPHDAAVLQTVCTRCGLPLRVDYRLGPGALSIESLRSRAPSLWRYEEVLPIRATDAVTLGEGFTPLVEVDGVLVKDEARNPTGSFKARGMTLAVSLARALGARALAAPSAGNAAGALAAYGPRDAFDVSTLKEPYRVEGKKTMAYELLEQLGELPDVIIYPTGGGTGLVGMWKAFGEMRELGW